MGRGGNPIVVVSGEKVSIEKLYRAKGSIWKMTDRARGRGEKKIFSIWQGGINKYFSLSVGHCGS